MPTSDARPTRRPARRRSTFRRLAVRGWVPDQHGAWPMAVVPGVVGALGSHPRGIHVLLVVAWVAGFLLFHVATLWIASPRRARYTPALVTWGASAAVAGGGLLALAPALVWWAPVFAPLVLVALVEALRRRTRSLASRVSTVLASCLTCAVAHDLGTGTVRGAGGWGGVWAPGSVSAPAQPGSSAQWWPWWEGAATVPGSGWGHAWIVTGVLAVYFLGTVPHVRALIRGRGNPAWVAGSLVWHVLGLLAVGAAARVGGVSWWVVAVWGLVLLRAVAIPLDQARRGPWRPLAIGLTEMVVCLLVAVAVLLPVGSA